MYRYIDSRPLLEHSSEEKEFVAFDLETTGLNPETDRITEIGAVKFTLTKQTDIFDELINPGKSIHPDAVRVSGITDEMVQGQPVIGDVLDPFLAFIGPAPLVAHNAPFDAAFLYHALLTTGRPLVANPLLDTRLLVKSLWPRFPGYSLTRVLDSLGIRHAALHRALEDAVACKDVFIVCVKKVNEENSWSHPVRMRTALRLAEENVDQSV